MSDYNLDYSYFSQSIEGRSKRYFCKYKFMYILYSGIFHSIYLVLQPRIFHSIHLFPVHMNFSFVTPLFCTYEFFIPYTIHLYLSKSNEYACRSLEHASLFETSSKKYVFFSQDFYIVMLKN